MPAFVRGTVGGQRRLLIGQQRYSGDCGHKNDRAQQTMRSKTPASKMQKFPKRCEKRLSSEDKEVLFH
jgi:hypothetical protein